MPDPEILEKMRGDWNGRAIEDARYYVAFGRRGQQDEEFFNSAADVVRSLEGERIILDENVFVERALPWATLRELAVQEMEVNRAPFRERDARLPTLVWPREQPIDGVPEDVVEIVARYGAWLQHAEMPKLFINAEPGSVIGDRARSFCRSWRNQHEITVKGRHFIQEDSPHEIGSALREFLLG